MQTSPTVLADGDATTGGHASAGLVTTVHRGPVTSVDGRVVGYTVTVDLEPAAAADGSGAAAAVAPADLHAEYMALDLANLVADRYVFLTATPEMLEGFLPTPVTPGRLVLDLPLGFEERPDAAERAAVLTALGARLALTGFHGSPAQLALLPHLGFVVVDGAAGLPLAQLVHHVHAADARVLATGAEDPAIQDRCRAAGVDGLRRTPADRFRRIPSPAPPPAVEQAPAPSGATVLRAGEQQCLAVLHLLHQEEVDFAALSQVIDTDPVLTLRVLHLVNSGAFALRHEIDTVSQAVVLLGQREVSTLVTGLMLDARPDAMDRLWFILARALTCEMLADDSAGYTVGMLSALSDQLGLPEEAVVQTVGVSESIAVAILEQEGQLGWVLAAVRAHERHDSTAVLTAGMLPAEVSSAYLRCLADALATARAVTREPGL